MRLQHSWSTCPCFRHSLLSWQMETWLLLAKRKASWRKECESRALRDRSEQVPLIVVLTIAVVFWHRSFCRRWVGDAREVDGRGPPLMVLSWWESLFCTWRQSKASGSLIRPLKGLVPLGLPDIVCSCTCLPAGATDPSSASATAWWVLLLKPLFPWLFKQLNSSNIRIEIKVLSPGTSFQILKSI